MNSQILSENNQKSKDENKKDFYLKSSKKLISFFNNTINRRNPSVDLIMSSPTGCMVITEVMKSYYLNTNLSKQDLVNKVVSGVSLSMNQSSVYKIVDKAIKNQIFSSVLKEDDKRVRLIVPTNQTVNDMEKWFDEINLV